VLANARRIIGCLRNADPARGVLGSAHATLLPKHAGAWPTRQQSPTAAAAAAAAAAGGVMRLYMFDLARAASSK